MEAQRAAQQLPLIKPGAPRALGQQAAQLLVQPD
jgi:hypothetical protein